MKDPRDFSAPPVANHILFVPCISRQELLAAKAPSFGSAAGNPERKLLPRHAAIFRGEQRELAFNRITQHNAVSPIPELHGVKENPSSFFFEHLFPVFTAISRCERFLPDLFPPGRS